MTDQAKVVVVRWPGQDDVAQDGLAGLLAAYHLATEAEKGQVVPDVDELPDRYRAEILDPRIAFAGDVVLVALIGHTLVGCLVVTAPISARSEIKRLWTQPAFRNRGIASGLLRVALTHAAAGGAEIVQLSVWNWRTEAIALYERFGFTVAASWDERDQLVCMEREIQPVAPGLVGH